MQIMKKQFSICAKILHVLASQMIMSDKELIVSDPLNEASPLNKQTKTRNLLS